MPRDEKETRAAVESGAVIGSFRLVAPLGAEGPALMWHAVDTTDGVPAILKLPRDATAATRLARAAAVLAGVSHPALPKVLDDGTRHDPPYLALEAVEESRSNPCSHAAPERSRLPLSRASSHRSPMRSKPCTKRDWSMATCSRRTSCCAPTACLSSPISRRRGSRGAPPKRICD